MFSDNRENFRRVAIRRLGEVTAQHAMILNVSDEVSRLKKVLEAEWQDME